MSNPPSDKDLKIIRLPTADIVKKRKAQLQKPVVWADLSNLIEEVHDLHCEVQNLKDTISVLLRELKRKLPRD